MYPGLRFVHKKNKVLQAEYCFGNCLFEYKIRLAVEKTKKKNWEMYDKIFFEKQKTLVFPLPDCFLRIKQPQK